MQKSKEFFNNMDLKNKFKLSDIESRFLVPRREEGDEPARSRDGLLLPPERLFWILVALYKVYLFLASISTVMITVIFSVTSVMLLLDRRVEEKDVVALAVPILLLIALVLIAHNIIGWIAIVTLRMRYLWADLWLHCLGLAVGLSYVFIDPSIDSGVGLVINVALVAFVYGLIREIRAANPGQV